MNPCYSAPLWGRGRKRRGGEHFTLTWYRSCVNVLPIVASNWNDRQSAADSTLASNQAVSLWRVDRNQYNSRLLMQNRRQHHEMSLLSCYAIGRSRNSSLHFHDSSEDHPTKYLFVVPAVRLATSLGVRRSTFVLWNFSAWKPSKNAG